MLGRNLGNFEAASFVIRRTWVELDLLANLLQ